MINLKFLNMGHTLKQNKMNSVLVFILAAMAPFIMGYDEVFDKVDVDKILADQTLYTAYMNCLLDKGPCSVEHSTEFRKIIPEVIATACEKCTEIQKKHVRKSVKALQERNPDEFNEFRAKYDPKGEYEKAFAEFMLKSD